MKPIQATDHEMKQLNLEKNKPNVAQIQNMSNIGYRKARGSLDN